MYVESRKPTFLSTSVLVLHLDSVSNYDRWTKNGVFGDQFAIVVKLKEIDALEVKLSENFDEFMRLTHEFFHPVSERRKTFEELMLQEEMFATNEKETKELEDAKTAKDAELKKLK
jgi:hypothetical protein